MSSTTPTLLKKAVSSDNSKYSFDNKKSLPNQEIPYLREIINKLEKTLAKLSADLFNQQRVNRGLREINSQLRESYEKSTGNRTHTPIPSYATDVDKQTHPSIVNEQNDSFEGFNTDSDDEGDSDVFEINKNLNRILAEMNKEKVKVANEVMALKSQIRLLEDNDLVLMEDIKKMRERMANIEKEREEFLEKIKNLRKLSFLVMLILMK